jgi:hypothetical protein
MSNFTQIVIELVIALVTIVGSITSSAFIAGMRWGRVNESVTSIDRRLAKIEGMFTLSLKDHNAS